MFIRDLYEAQARRIVAIMPGGFHPFHPGHKSLYDWAVKTFGAANVYVAATNDTSARPFPFDVKKKLANMAGVPMDRFIQVKSPFNLNSYKELLDDNTAIVFVRSLKDKGEQPLPDQIKKDGTPGYLKTFTGKNLEPANTSGYMAYGPTIDFDFSGMKIKSASELRATWPNMSAEEKLQAAKLMYGNGAPLAVKLLDQALGSVENEAIGRDELVKKMSDKQHQRMTDQVLKYLDMLVKKDNTKDIHSHAFTIGREVNLDAIGLDSKSLVQLYKSKFEDVSPEDEDKFHNELDDLVHKYFGDSPDEEKMKQKMDNVKETPYVKGSYKKYDPTRFDEPGKYHDPEYKRGVSGERNPNMSLQFQLKKAITLNGQYDVFFKNGETVKVDQATALNALTKLDRITKPQDKLKAAEYIGKSYNNLLAFTKRNADENN